MIPLYVLVLFVGPGSSFKGPNTLFIQRTTRNSFVGSEKDFLVLVRFRFGSKQVFLRSSTRRGRLKLVLSLAPIPSS
jgi:hypothetical protein